MTSRKPNDILIFRTVSIEKMDQVLDTCRSRWSEGRLVVISSKNRRAELHDDPRIREVIAITTGPNGFPRRIDLYRTFQAVVLPIGNRLGSGYGNVFSAACSCLSDEIYIMPYAGKLHRISAIKLRFGMILESVFLALSLPIAWLAAKMIVFYE